MNRLASTAGPDPQFGGVPLSFLDAFQAGDVDRDEWIIGTVLVCLRWRYRDADAIVMTTRALMDALLDHSSSLAIDPTEWLTIAARRNDERPRLAPADSDAQTFFIRLRGSDLAAFLARQISKRLLAWARSSPKGFWIRTADPFGSCSRMLPISTAGTARS